MWSKLPSTIYRINSLGDLVMWFIVPVVLLNVLGVLLTFTGQPLFGLALCALSFLYIAKTFID